MTTAQRSRRRKTSKNFSPVEARDGEIRNAFDDLLRTNSYELSNLRSRNHSNERQISRLSTEIEYLQQRNEDLQRRLDEAAIKTGSLERDKETVIRTADMELYDAKSELERTTKEQEILDNEIRHMKAERAALISEMDDSKSLLGDEIAQLRELLSKAHTDKKKLSSRITKLTNNERELVLEIDRLKHRSSSVKNGKKTNKHVENLIKCLEEERNYWKSEADGLSKLLKLGGTVRSRSISPSRKGSTKALQEALQTAEEERNHFRRECDLLKAMRRSPSPSRRSQSKANSNEINNEFDKMKKERDELQLLLDKFERHMAEIQSNVKVLTSERDKLAEMYKESKQELDRLRRDVVRSTKSAKSSIAVQNVLHRVESERDGALTELRRMTTERDSLRERLKIATETHLSDRAHLEQKVDDLESAMRGSELDKDEAINRLKSMQDVIDAVEAKVRVEGEASATHKATATQMRLIAEKAERAAHDAQRQLAKYESEVRASREKIADLEAEAIGLRRQVSGERDQSKTLHSSIVTAKRDNDRLKEEVTQFSLEVEAKDKAMIENRRLVNELESQLDRYKGEFKAHEEEINDLRRKKNEIGDELCIVKRSREELNRENRKLVDELNATKEEFRQLQAQLEDADADEQELKDQIQGYVAEVKRVEDLLNSKEQQRNDLLEQFKTMSASAERYETATHELQSQSSSLKLELTTRDAEIRRYKDRAEDAERQLAEFSRSEISYQSQIAGLTKSVAQLEECLRRGETEKRYLSNDLSAVRDICGKSELTKDQIARQFARSQTQHAELARTVEELKSENNDLRDQLSCSHDSISKLEDLMHSSKDRNFQNRIAQQEADSEINLLKDRLNLNESKVDSQNKELNLLRSKNIQVEAEVDKLRRQLTNERFEKERAAQELRRHGIAPPGERLQLRTMNGNLSSY